MTAPRAIHKDVIFQFEGEITTRTVSGIQQTLFKEMTSWGFEYSNTKDSMETSRWGNVVAVGPEVKDIKAGMRVLIEPLKWTNAFEINNTKYWKTNIDHVLLIDDDVVV